MRLPNYSEKKANKVIELYKSGLKNSEVAERVKLKISQINWIVRKSGIKRYRKKAVQLFKKPDKVDYGCIVCSESKKGGGRGFCSKHYYRYVVRPERTRKIKGL